MNRSYFISLCLIIFTAVPFMSIACEHREPTRQTGMGPHFAHEATDNTQLWTKSDPGEPVFLRARVIDTCGKPLANARVQLWHADHDGMHHEDRWRADFNTDDKGSFKVTTVMPGFAGGLPRHIHIIVNKGGYTKLVTRIFFKNDPSASEWDADLIMNVDEVQRNERRGWVGSYEFVLQPEG